MEFILQVALVVGTIVILNQVFKRRLRRQERGDLSGSHRVLFSLPTLCERLPAVVESPAHPTQLDCTVWDDFWLQIELVPHHDHEHIENVLQELEAFKEQHRKGQGYREIFTRHDHHTPLDTLRIGAEDVRAAMLHPAEGHLFLRTGRGAPMLVEGGFALKLEGIGFLYGCEIDGAVRALGIQPKSGKGNADESWQRLRALMRRHQLILVDWLSGKTVTEERNSGQ